MLACVMAAGSYPVAALLANKVQKNTDGVQLNTERLTVAVCAIIEYGDETIKGVRAEESD